MPWVWKHQNLETHVLHKLKVVPDCTVGQQNIHISIECCSEIKYYINEYFYNKKNHYGSH